MKIALCLSGQPRFVEKGFEGFRRNLIEQNPNCEFDIFCHTNFSPENCGQLYNGSAHNQGRTGTVDPNVLNTILELYKPIQLIVEPDVKEHHLPNCTINRAACCPMVQYIMIRGWSESMEMAHRHSVYDLYIHSRYDCLLKTPTNLEKPEPNTVYSLPLRNHPDPNIPCDWFNYFDDHTSIHYIDLYQNLDNLISQGTLACGEELFKAHFRSFQDIYKLKRILGESELIRDSN